MLYKGGTTILSLEHIHFLHSFLSNKPTYIHHPKTLLQLLKTPRYISQFKEQGLSFQHLKQYFDLISSGKLNEYKYKLDPSLKPAPLPQRAIILPPKPIPPQPIPPQQTAPPAAVIAPAPSGPGKLKKFADFLKKTFKKKSPAPPPPLLIPPPLSRHALTHASVSPGYKAPYATPPTRRKYSSSSLSSISTGKKTRRRGYAGMKDSDEVSLISKSTVRRHSPEPSSPSRSSFGTEPSTPSRSSKHKKGPKRLDEDEIARKLGRRKPSSSKHSLTSSAEDEKLKRGAPALYALIKGARYIGKGTKDLLVKGKDKFVSWREAKKAKAAAKAIADARAKGVIEPSPSPAAAAGVRKVLTRTAKKKTSSLSGSLDALL